MEITLIEALGIASAFAAALFGFAVTKPKTFLAFKPHLLHAAWLATCSCWAFAFGASWAIRKAAPKQTIQLDGLFWLSVLVASSLVAIVLCETVAKAIVLKREV